MKKKKLFFCPCNSGRPYSSCCISKKIVVFDPCWQKSRQMAKTVIYEHLVPYLQSFDFKIRVEAWLEFWGDENEWPSGVLEDCFETVFIPWVLFQRKCGSDGPIAVSYLKENRSSLSIEEQHFIQAACHTQYGFYIVRNMIPGLQLEVQDLLSSRYFFIKEPSLSELLVCGDILFMSLLEIEGQTLSLGIAPYSIPYRYAPLFLEFKQDLERHEKITTRSLKGASFEIKEQFLAILRALLNTSENRRSCLN